MNTKTPKTRKTKPIKRGRPQIDINLHPDAKTSVKAFKERIKQMSEQPDETSAFDAETIRIILEELDDTDRNLLIAYYSFANCSATKLGRYLNIGPTTITNRIKSIQNRIKRLNDTVRDPYNRPRVDPDN